MMDVLHKSFRGPKDKNPDYTSSKSDSASLKSEAPELDTVEKIGTMINGIGMSNYALRCKSSKMHFQCFLLYHNNKGLL